MLTLRAFAACLTLIVLSWGVVISSVAQAPGIAVLASLDYPLNFGFARLFGVSAAQQHLVTIMSLPATYATCALILLCSLSADFAVS